MLFRPGHVLIHDVAPPLGACRVLPNSVSLSGKTMKKKSAITHSLCLYQTHGTNVIFKKKCCLKGNLLQDK